MLFRHNLGKNDSSFRNTFIFKKKPVFLVLLIIWIIWSQQVCFLFLYYYIYLHLKHKYVIYWRQQHFWDFFQWFVTLGKTQQDSSSHVKKGNCISLPSLTHKILSEMRQIYKRWTITLLRSMSLDLPFCICPLVLLLKESIFWNTKNTWGVLCILVLITTLSASLGAALILSYL